MSNAIPTIGRPEVGSVSRLVMRLETNVAIAQSPIARAVQRQIRAGARWLASLQYEVLLDSDIDAMSSWLDRAVRGDTLLAIESDANLRLGTFTPTELAASWSLGTTGWTTSQTALTVDGDTALVRVSVNNTSGYITKTYNVVAGATYAIALDVVSIGGANAAGGLLQVLEGGTARSVCFSQTDQKLLCVVTPVGTTIALRIYPAKVLPAALDTIAAFGAVSVQRCLVAATSNGAFAVRDTAGTTTGVALKRGQMISVLTSAGWELKRVSAPALINSAGVAACAVEPGFRGTWADGNPVLVGVPFGIYRPSLNESGASYSPGCLAAFAFEIEEHIESGLGVFDRTKPSEGMSLYLDFAAQDYRTQPAGDAPAGLEGLPS